VLVHCGERLRYLVSDSFPLLLEQPRGQKPGPGLLALPCFCLVPVHTRAQWVFTWPVPTCPHVLAWTLLPRDGHTAQLVRSRLFSHCYRHSISNTRPGRSKSQVHQQDCKFLQGLKLCSLAGSTTFNITLARFSQRGSVSATACEKVRLPLPSLASSSFSQLLYPPHEGLSFLLSPWEKHRQQLQARGHAEHQSNIGEDQSMD